MVIQVSRVSSEKRVRSVGIFLAAVFLSPTDCDFSLYSLYLCFSHIGKILAFKKTGKLLCDVELCQVYVRLEV